MAIKPTVIRKAGKGAIQVSGTSFKNVDYIDVRNFYEDGSGALKPTPKGIMISLDQVENVAKAMLAQLAAYSKAKSEGTKLYVVLQASSAAKVSNREIRVRESRVFEDYASARRKRNNEGDVIFAFTGDFVLSSTTYVFPPEVKKRRVAQSVNGAWVKQANL